mmetsp:Transcript_16923/g.42587  ORF Transcript_16923/g.42587 Transcript_16923/m.42587 type:complete len:98 (+) Transcript_16923:57-350(+)
MFHSEFHILLLCVVAAMCSAILKHAVAQGAALRLQMQPRRQRMHAQQLLAGRVGGAPAAVVVLDESDAGAESLVGRAREACSADALLLCTCARCLPV